MYRAREVYGMGLYAGLTYTEMRHMFPGFILDMYVYHMKNEAQLLGPKTVRKLLG